MTDTLPLVKKLRFRTNYMLDPESDACIEVGLAADAIERLVAALEQSAEWFQGYADSHTAKGDTDKAKRNQDRADAARTALLRVRAMR